MPRQATMKRAPTKRRLTSSTMRPPTLRRSSKTAILKKTLLRRLQLALKGLDDRSRDILQRRWLTDDKATLHDLADVYGVSAERIRQLEKNAMKKLRQKMGDAAIAA